MQSDKASRVSAKGTSSWQNCSAASLLTHITLWELQQPWRTDANTVAPLNFGSLKMTRLQNGNNVSWLWTKWGDIAPYRVGGTVHTEHVRKLENIKMIKLPPQFAFGHGAVTHTQLMSPHLWTGLTGNNNSLWAKNETVAQNLSSNVPSNELGKTFTGSFVCLSKGNLVNLAATTVMIYTRWNCPHNCLIVILNSCFALFRRQSSRFTRK